MAIKRYLAMTAAEIEGNPAVPFPIGWMACQFSPYSQGLSNLPGSLPEDSLLILNDFTPIDGHDPSVVGAQLRQCIDSQKCTGLLLDFQREGNPQTEELVSFLVEALPCPVVVSEPYGANRKCPVFLPPLPHHLPLSEYLTPWQGREIWLDLALDGETITLSKEKAAIAPLPPGEVFDGGHREETLHCHYRTELLEDSACFTLWRTREDLEEMLEEAEALGIKTAVGLYQELG
jgi:hypothetical protein